MFLEETIDKLKAEHGDDLHLFSGSGHEIVVRAPSRAEWKRFRAAQADATKKLDALEHLVRTCCVAPAAAELSAIFEKRPALADAWGAELMAIAGLGEEVASRKL